MPTSSRGSPLQHQHPSYQGNDGSGVLVGRNGGGVEASSAFMVSPATTLGHKSLAPMGAGLQLNSLGNSMQPVAGTGGMGPPGDFLVATGGDGAGGSGRVFGLQSSVQQQRQEWAGDIGNVSSDNTSSSGGSSNPPGLPSEWNNTTAAEAGHAQQAVMRPQQQQSNQVSIYFSPKVAMSCFLLSAKDGTRGKSAPLSAPCVSCASMARLGRAARGLLLSSALRYSAKHFMFLTQPGVSRYVLK